MFSVSNYVHYCMQNVEENKLKLKLNTHTHYRHVTVLTVRTVLTFNIWFFFVNCR